MKPPGWLVVIAAWLILAQQTVAMDLGVGFSLSLDYGTSSVYYENGTMVGVAKIEGSPAYKALMYAQPWGNDTLSDCVPQFRERPIIDDVPSWRDRIPDWLTNNPTNSSVVTMSQMLQGLKAATESYLVSDLGYVGIATPDRATEEFAEVLRSAARRALLNQDGVGGLSALGWGSNANQILDQFCDQPARLTLILDHTRAALAAMVTVDDCGYLTDYGTLHDQTLGMKHWSNETRTNLVQKVRKLIIDGREEAKSGSEAPVSKIVLLGEYGHDERVKQALEDVLLGDDGLQSIMPWDMPAQPQDVHVDPLYASAAGIASRTWDHLMMKERNYLCTMQIDPRYLRPPTEQEQTDEATVQAIGGE